MLEYCFPPGAATWLLWQEVIAAQTATLTTKSIHQASVQNLGRNASAVSALVSIIPGTATGHHGYDMLLLTSSVAATSAYVSMVLGAGHSCLVGGPPGAGKSAVVRHLLCGTAGAFRDKCHVANVDACGTV